MSSFFVYSLKEPETQRTGHILLHSEKPKWLAVNPTTLDIAQRLERGENKEYIISRLAQKFKISKETVKKDVLNVAKELKRHSFLDSQEQNKSERKPNLKSLHLHLTSRCNLNCDHCYNAVQSRTIEDIPTTTVFRLIDEFTQMGGQHLTLSGGEPMLHQDFKNIIRYASSNLETRLLTNGTLIDKKMAEFLAEQKIWVQISLDGSTEEKHDFIRGKGSFRKSLSAIRFLQDAGLEKQINTATVVLDHNLDDLSNIISLGVDLGIPLVRFLPLRRGGRADKNWDSIGSRLSPSQYEKFFQCVLELGKNKQTTTVITCGLSGMLLHIPQNGSDDNIWCPLGRKMVIETGGDVYPGVLLMKKEFKLGNVYEQSLSQMIESESMRQTCQNLVVRKDKIEECRECLWQNFCQAGCMGQALEHRDTIWDRDDFCTYRKKAYKEAFDIIIKDTIFPS